MEETLSHRRHTDHGLLRPIDARLALAFLLTVGGGSVYVTKQHADVEGITVQQAEQLRADRSRYEDLQQHCYERELDHLERNQDHGNHP